MKLPFLSDEKHGFGGAEPYCVKTGAGIDTDWAIPGLSELYCPEESDEDRENETWVGEPGGRDIVDVLVETGKLSREQRAKVRQGVLSNPGRSLEELLPKWQMVGPEEVLEAKARLYGVAFRRIRAEDVAREAFAMLDIGFMKSNGIIPVCIEDDVLVVGTSEPENVFVLQEVSKQTQMDLEVLVCSRNDVLGACEYFEQEAKEEDVKEKKEEESPEDEADYSVEDVISDIRNMEVLKDEGDAVEDVEEPVEDSAVVQFVNYVISNAMREGRGDIQIEPEGGGIKIRYRLEGVVTVNNGPAKIAGVLGVTEICGQGEDEGLVDNEG